MIDIEAIKEFTGSFQSPNHFLDRTEGRMAISFLCRLLDERETAIESELIWVQHELQEICKAVNQSAKPNTPSAIRSNAVNRAMSELNQRIAERRALRLAALRA